MEGSTPNTFSRIIKCDLNGWPAYPDITDGQSSKSNENRLFSGNIDEIGNDIRRVKNGADHIIFGYNFVPIGRDVNNMIDISKRLSKFAR